MIDNTKENQIRIMHFIFVIDVLIMNLKLNPIPDIRFYIIFPEIISSQADLLLEPIIWILSLDADIDYLVILKTARYFAIGKLLVANQNAVWVVQGFDNAVTQGPAFFVGVFICKTIVAYSGRAGNIGQLKASITVEVNIIPILTWGSVAGGNKAINLVIFGIGVEFREGKSDTHILRDCFFTFWAVIVNIKAHDIFFAVLDGNIVALIAIKIIFWSYRNEVLFVTKHTIANRVKDNLVAQCTIFYFLNGIAGATFPWVLI